MQKEIEFSQQNKHALNTIFVLISLYFVAKINSRLFVVKKWTHDTWNKINTNCYKIYGVCDCQIKNIAKAFGKFLSSTLRADNLSQLRLDQFKSDTRIQGNI